MITFTTAKLLLFVGLFLGPKDNNAIYVTSTGDNCLWTAQTQGWSLEEKRYPTSDWDTKAINLSNSEVNDFGKKTPQADAIRAHDWSKGSVLHLDNGDLVEKHGKYIFYTVNAGSASQIIYTICRVKPD